MSDTPQAPEQASSDLPRRAVAMLMLLSALLCGFVAVTAALGGQSGLRLAQPVLASVMFFLVADDWRRRPPGRARPPFWSGKSAGARMPSVVSLLVAAALFVVSIVSLVRD